MVVSYEILFTRAQNQHPGAKIYFKYDNLGIKRFLCTPKLADFMLKTNTPSRISERFFKQISFHAKYTFSHQINFPELKMSSIFYNWCLKASLQLKYLKREANKHSPFHVPLRIEAKNINSVSGAPHNLS